MAALVPWAVILLFAGELEPSATVVAEARGGQAPQRVGDEPTAGFIGVLTPGVGLRLLESDLDATVDYQARIFWRQPNVLSRTSPLILHMTNLSVVARSTPTITTTAGASFSYGEVDYTTLSQLLAPTSMGGGPMGAPQAALPAVADFFSGSARAGIEVAAGRLWRYAVPIELQYRQPVGAGTGSMPAGMVSGFLQRQASVALSPSATARLSRRNDLLLLAALSNRWFESGVDFLIVAPQVGWRHRFSATDDLRFTAGVAYGRYLATAPTPAPGSGSAIGSRSSLSPVGNAEANWLLLRHRGIGMQGTLGTTVEYFVDPILALAYARGTVYARTLLFLGDRWTAAFEGSLGTSLRESGPLGGGTTPPDQTVASVSLPVRYHASDGLVIEFGARWSDRAPHYGGSLFEFHQRQAWLYTTLTATTRDMGRWALPDLGDGARRNRPPAAEESQEPDRQGRLPDQRAP